MAKYKRGDLVTNKFTRLKGVVRFTKPGFFTVETKKGHRITNPKFWNRR